MTTGGDNIGSSESYTNRKSPRREKPVRIAMLGSLPPIRGLSSYCLDLVLALLDRLTIEFISFKALYPAALYPGDRLADDETFPPLDHPALNVRRRLAWYNPLTWLTEAFGVRAELLHAQWWSLPLFPVYYLVCAGFRLRGRPVVITVHNVRPHERSPLYRLLSRLLFQLGDHLIVHTASARAQLCKYYGIAAGRVSVVPHGPLAFHVGQDMDRGRIRKELGFAPHQKVVLVFGAIRPYKGIDTALRAFARVSLNRPELRLLIAGRLWEKWEPYQQLIAKLKIESNVSTRLEYIPSGDVHRFFCAADMIVLPYRHFDSQSGVASTAVAFRKPMVVTNVGGLPDLVPDKRFVVPPDDPPALANAMDACLAAAARPDTLAADLESVARAIAGPVIADKTVAVYRSLVRKSLNVGED